MAWRSWGLLLVGPKSGVDKDEDMIALLGGGMEVEESMKTPTKITTLEEAIYSYLFGNMKSESAKSSATSRRDPSHQKLILQKFLSDLESWITSIPRRTAIQIKVGIKGIAKEA